VSRGSSSSSSSGGSGNKAFIISAATSRAFFRAEKLIFPKEHQNPDVNIKCKQLL
jgi:hypothetical protein